MGLASRAKRPDSGLGIRQKAAVLDIDLNSILGSAGGTKGRDFREKVFNFVHEVSQLFDVSSFGCELKVVSDDTEFSEPETEGVPLHSMPEPLDQGEVVGFKSGTHESHFLAAVGEVLWTHAHELPLQGVNRTRVELAFHDHHNHSLMQEPCRRRIAAPSDSPLRNRSA